MPKVFRSSDVVEVHGENALTYAAGAVAAFVFSGLMLRYEGSKGVFAPLAVIVLLIGLGLAGYATYRAFLIRKVRYVYYTCPYCETGNALTEEATGDFICIDCNRLIPVKDGKILEVHQVRCGFCNALNYFNEKTDVLLCEECNHEVPLAHDDGHIAKKKLASGYAVEEDDRPYELILVAHGPKTEELITTLQQMLALNRNQVKDMLTELPVTLLTGIPKKKAQMLQAQLSIHDGAADTRPLDESMI